MSIGIDINQELYISAIFPDIFDFHTDFSVNTIQMMLGHNDNRILNGKFT